jgi:hypothetical protein
VAVGDLVVLKSVPLTRRAGLNVACNILTHIWPVVCPRDGAVCLVVSIGSCRHRNVEVMQDVQPDLFMIWDTGSPVVIGRILVTENSIFDIEVFDMRRRDLKVNKISPKSLSCRYPDLIPSYKVLSTFATEIWLQMARWFVLARGAQDRGLAFSWTCPAW